MISLGANIASREAQRLLERHTTAAGSAAERLASGQRINRAADDAAALAIAGSLNADTRILGQAMRNISDGLSLVNVAQGALSALSDITIRQQELATQAANGVYNAAQRSAMQNECNALTDEFNRIIDSTSFNGRKLFEDSLEQVCIQAGRGDAQTLNLTIGRALAEAAASPTLAFGSGASQVDTFDFSTQTQRVKTAVVFPGPAESWGGWQELQTAASNGTLDAGEWFTIDNKTVFFYTGTGDPSLYDPAPGTGNIGIALTSDMGTLCSDLTTALGMSVVDSGPFTFISSSPITFDRGTAFSTCSTVDIPDNASNMTSSWLDLTELVGASTTVGFRVNHVPAPGSIGVDVLNGATPQDLAIAMQSALGSISGFSTYVDGDKLVFTSNASTAVDNPDQLISGEWNYPFSNVWQQADPGSVVIQDGDALTFRAGDGSDVTVLYRTGGEWNPPGGIAISVDISVYSTDFDTCANLNDVLSDTAQAINNAATSYGLDMHATVAGKELQITRATPDALGGVSYSFANLHTSGTAGSAPDVNLTTDAITINNHGLHDGDTVTLGADGSLPGGLIAGSYYVKAVDANTIKLSTSSNLSSFVNLTSYGSGMHTLAVEQGETGGQSFHTDYLDLSSPSAARTTVESCFARLQNIATDLGSLGSHQSRLETALRSTAAAHDSYIAAESRIRDADIAEESEKYLREQIAQQAAAAVLAQANLQPNMALKLLSG